LIADYPYCAVSALRYREKGLAAGKAALTFEPLGIAVPGNDPLLVNWVQNILTILKGNGSLKELKKRWFQPGDWLKKLQ
jgi:polar amino acid transport system substrate-binding protein